MGLGESLMKIVVKVRDVVELARRFETAPAETMREVVATLSEGVRQTLEEVMEAEIGLFLGQGAERGNKRNGFATRRLASRVSARSNCAYRAIDWVVSIATWCQRSVSTTQRSSATWRFFTSLGCPRECFRI